MLPKHLVRALALAAAVSASAGCAVQTVAEVDSSPSAPATLPATVPATGGAAVLALNTLAVKGRAPLTGYTRARFGAAWTDDNDAPGGHNGCDTRNDVLARDLTADVLKPGTRGCVLLSGTLRDPYTGAAIEFVRGRTTSSLVQIDHVVALADAWQTGAQQLDTERRRRLANDPLELLAVSGRTNQAKGAGDAATWLPPRRGYWCDYVARQIAVKQAYALWVTPAEKAAMARVLSQCPAQPLPTR